MKWILEFSDMPQDKDYPIVGYQITDTGIKRGPYLYKVEDVVNSLTAFQNETITSTDYGANIFLNEKRIPTLPVGTIGYSSSDQGNERISLVIKKDIWPIKYQNDPELYFIGFPRLIIQYVLVPLRTNGLRRVMATKIFAIKDDQQPVSDETKLYAFPFPNVSKEDGKVCWGENSNFTIANLLELDKFFAYFLSAPFGEDYGMRLADGSLTFGKYIETHQHKSFDDELLLPVMKGEEHLTFGTLYGTEFVNDKCR